MLKPRDSRYVEPSLCMRPWSRVVDGDERGRERERRVLIRGASCNKDGKHGRMGKGVDSPGEGWKRSESDKQSNWTDSVNRSM